MYVLKLKLNRLVVYKSPSSNFIISVLGTRTLKKGSYEVYFINFKKLSQLLWRPGLTEIRFSPVFKRLLKDRLGL